MDCSASNPLTGHTNICRYSLRVLENATTLCVRHTASRQTVNRPRNLQPLIMTASSVSYPTLNISHPSVSHLQPLLLYDLFHNNPLVHSNVPKMANSLDAYPTVVAIHAATFLLAPRTSKQNGRPNKNYDFLNKLHSLEFAFY
jgi:hypothetical protein